MSLAKIGSSAVMPPTSTTNRSSDITPSSTLRLQMKENPANTLSSVIGRLSCLSLMSWMPMTSTAATAHTIAQVA